MKTGHRFENEGCRVGKMKGRDAISGTPYRGPAGR